MSAALVVDMRDLPQVFTLLQIYRILHECSPCCRYRESYTSVPLVADIEDLT